MQKEFIAAIKEICEEKGIDESIVIETIEAALSSAYRKDFGTSKQKIRASFDQKTGQTKIYRVWEVVEEVENPESQITLPDAKKKKKGIKIGGVIEKELEAPSEYGRIAAQTAKQVVIQRIREAERDVLYNEYKKKEGEIINGTVQQLEGRNVIINIGKLNGIMFPQDQMQDEKHYIGQRLKIYIVSVEKTSKAPQVLLSRTHPELIKRLFELEVPEINAKTVEIKSIAREPGKRTKMAVVAHQEGVDPIGSCVGQRGTRVQAVLAEIGDEKIDIILWDKKQTKFIESALSPAKVKKVVVSEINKNAKVYVDPAQLSLAIGKEGQNVRLASKLTGWTIDVQAQEEKKKIKKEVKKEDKKPQKKTEKQDTKKTASEIKK